MISSGCLEEQKVNLNSKRMFDNINIPLSNMCVNQKIYEECKGMPEEGESKGFARKEWWYI